MDSKRIIAKIDVKDNYLVKGIHLEGLRKIGDPYKFAEKYYLDGIDEIIFHDVTATLYGHNNLKEIITRLSKNIFIPILVGGGIRSPKDIEELLSNGADRVMLNSAVIKDVNFLKDSAYRFGSANLAANVEYSIIDGKPIIFYEYGRQKTTLNFFDWIKKLEDFGAGEIIFTSIDHEGSGKGYEQSILEKVLKTIQIPITLHGGISKVSQLQVAIKKYPKVSGLCLSSLLHYNYFQNNLNNKIFVSSKWEKSNIKQIKKKLSKTIKIRL